MTSVDGHDVKVVKLHGAFVWHIHCDTDELLLVLSGEMTSPLRDLDGAS